MKIGTFRRNVLKTVATKAVKQGFKQVARNTNRTQLAESTISLNIHTGHILQSLTPYVLGEQMLPSMTQAATTAFGDVLADLVVLSRVLKVKMPTATKKSKLVGTRTAALMHLFSLNTDLLATVNQGIVVGPVLKKVTKMVVLPNKGGAKEEREVDVIDTEAETISEAVRQDQARQLVDAIVDVYWRLVFDIFKAPPEVIIDAKFVDMLMQHSGVEFDVDDETDTEGEGMEEVPEPVPATSATK